MRKTLHAASFFLSGLVTTWLACWFGSQMTFRIKVGWSLQLPDGCYEIGQCSSMPWWAAALFLGYLPGPSFALGVIGWRCGRHGVSVTTTSLILLAACIFLALFYLATYAIAA